MSSVATIPDSGHHATCDDVRTHFVYRLYATNGALLYVGITVDLGTRLTAHKRTQSWWSQVDHHTVEEAPTRADAFFLEAEAILREHPTHNKDIPTWQRYDVLRARATVSGKVITAEDRIASLERQLREQKRIVAQMQDHSLAAASLGAENDQLRSTIAEKDREIGRNAEMSDILVKSINVWRTEAQSKEQAQIFVVEGPRLVQPAAPAPTSAVPQPAKPGLIRRFLGSRA